MRQKSVVLQWTPRPPAASPWTAERVAHLKARLLQGATARQIARELGHGISRCAVLGKVHRLRLDDLLLPDGRPERAARGRVRPLRKPVDLGAMGLARRPGVLPAWVVNARPYVDEAGVDADIPLSQRRSLLELDSRTCRWPVGDPAQPDFFFCGGAPLRNKPYCAEHHARAYRPQEDAASEDAAWCAPGTDDERTGGDHGAARDFAVAGETATSLQPGE
jgi:GcrA cell cycle regulator